MLIADKMFGIIVIIIGLVAGLIGTFLFVPPLLATSVILISTPWIIVISDYLLTEKWSQITTMFLLITVYISISVWVLGEIDNIASYQNRVGTSLIIVGAGTIHLIWILLIIKDGRRV